MLKMVKYVDYIKRLKFCPFCNVNSNKVILSNDSAILIVSKAPYHNDHLLVVPKRHNSSFLRLTPKELSDTNELIKSSIRLLNSLGHRGVSVLVRNRKASGKSVNHLHYHIIPDTPVTAIHTDMFNREVISDAKEFSKVRSFRKLLNNL